MKRNDIKLLVFDVDGTLYDTRNHKIPESTIEALNTARENGYYIAIATGRSHFGLGKALNSLKPDYIISVSGACVVDKNWNTITRHSFAFEDVEEILNFSKANDAGLVFKFIDHMYIYQYPEKVNWIKNQKASDVGEEPFINCFEENHHYEDLPMGCCVHANSNKVDEKFENHPRIQFTRYSEDGYDVVLRGVNKGKAIRELLKYLDMTEDNVACFGDNYNDIEMMEVSGYRVAMGNAVDKIKEMADYVTTSCDNDGIYNALKHMNII